MTFDWKRWKILDFVVMGAFVLTIVGVSLTWWKAADWDQSGYEEAVGGLDDLGGLGTGDLLGGLQGTLGDALNTAKDFAFEHGWESGLGVTAFIFALLAFVWVAIKSLMPAGAALPNWYKEGVGLMGLGGLATLMAFIGLFVVPKFMGVSTPREAWSWRPGSLITLFGALAIVGCGFLMFRDKSGDYAGPGKFKVPEGLMKLVQGDQETQGGGAAGGGQTNAATAAPAAKFCVDCGTPVQPGADACENCGKTV